jgi:small subunit ribosomal protein S3
MGQKVNPIGLRLGINRTWDSRWFAGKRAYGDLLHEDMAIRKYLHKRLKQAGVSRIIIERPHKKCRVTIYTARPGVVIGKKGADIEKLRQELSKLSSSETVLNIVEIRKPEIDATLVAENIAQQLERRVAFRRAMKRAMQTLRADIDYGVATARTTYGAIGVKVWIFKGEILEHDPLAQEKRLVESQTGGVAPTRRDESRREPRT